MTDQVIVFGSFSFKEAEEFQRLSATSSSLLLATNPVAPSGSLPVGGVEVEASEPAIGRGAHVTSEVGSSSGTLPKLGPHTNGRAASVQVRSAALASAVSSSGSAPPASAAALTSPSSAKQSPPRFAPKPKPPSPPIRTSPPPSAWAPKTKSPELSTPPKTPQKPTPVTQVASHVVPAPALNAWGGVKQISPDSVARPSASPPPSVHSPSVPTSPASSTTSAAGGSESAWSVKKQKSPVVSPASPRAGTSSSLASPLMTAKRQVAAGGAVSSRAGALSATAAGAATVMSPPKATTSGAACDGAEVDGEVAASCKVAGGVGSATVAAAVVAEASKVVSVVGEEGRESASASLAVESPAQQGPRPAAKSWAALVGVQMQWEQVPKSVLNPGKGRGIYVPPPPRPTPAMAVTKAKAAAAIQLTVAGVGATPANPPLSGPAWVETLQLSESGRNAQLQPRGLLNTGNSCFLNSTLQALLSLPPFLQLLLSLRSWTLPATCPTLRAFSRFVSEFELLPPVALEGSDASASAPAADMDTESAAILDLGRPFAPDFVDVLERFSPGQQPRGRGCRTRQEDAQEFLSFVMDRMHEELLQLENRSAPDREVAVVAANGGAPGVASPASEDGDEWETVGPKNRTAVTRTHSLAESALSDIFGGQLCSVIRTKGSKPSATVQPFLLLQLDILPETVHSVQDALQQYTVPEQLDGYKGKHGKADTAYKQVKFQSLPRVLVLHLMRFSFGASGTGKVHKPVTFPLTLELGRDLVASSSEVKNTYELVATVSHHGKDPSDGHYTADTKQSDKRWLRFDDGNVTVVPVKNVLQSQAYLLLYKRIV